MPTHSPLGKKKEFKDTVINAPSEITFKDPSLPLRFPSPSIVGVQILNRMAHLNLQVAVSGSNVFVLFTKLERNF